MKSSIHRTRICGFCLLAAATLLPIFRADAISISLAYLDESDPFFTTPAKSTLAKAASDLSLAITTTLAPLSQDVYSGTFGSTTFTANWRLSFTHPYTGLTTHVDTFDLEENEFRIFLGRRSLAVSTLAGRPFRSHPRFG